MNRDRHCRVGRIRPCRRRCTCFGAALSQSHRHHHRALLGRRARRPARPPGCKCTVGKAETEFRRRERHRWQHDHRHQPVAHATPDGYTLLVHNLQISANATLYKNLPFDTEKDLATVMFIYRNPLVLVGRPTLSANSLDELLALMKTQRMKSAIPGFGATGHLATTLLSQEAKVPIDLIPYRGGAPMLTDVMGNHVDLSFGTPQQVGPFVKAGKLKAFGVTQENKMPEFPQADSFVKMFGPKLEIQFWEAMFAPAGTPDAVIKTLNAALEAPSSPILPFSRRGQRRVCPPTRKTSVRRKPAARSSRVKSRAGPR